VSVVTLSCSCNAGQVVLAAGWLVGVGQNVGDAAELGGNGDVSPFALALAILRLFAPVIAFPFVDYITMLVPLFTRVLSVFLAVLRSAFVGPLVIPELLAVGIFIFDLCRPIARAGPIDVHPFAVSLAVSRVLA
jgi:hypothetical protein